MKRILRFLSIFLLAVTMAPGEAHALETKAGSIFDFYGFLRVDSIYDDSAPNDNQIIGYILSEDPSTGRPKNDSSYTMTPRLTRLGFNFKAPRLGAYPDLKITGKLEMDFYGSPASDSRNQIRMRHAYLKMAWKDIFLLAGQTSDLISPLYPAVNWDEVMWGAGNLGDRRPQMRLDFHPRLGPGRIYIQGAAGLTNAVSQKNFDSTSILNGEDSGKPTVQGRLAYRLPHFFGPGALEVGIYGDRAWEESNVALVGKSQWKSWAYGLDAVIPVYRDRVWVKGEVWRGSNADDIRGGIFQGINTTTGREIESAGGWGEMGVRLTDWNTTSLGYSFDNPKHKDLTAGDSKSNRDKNEIFYLASRVNLFDPVTIGLEYLNWTTYFKGQGSGDDNRLKIFFMYRF